MAWVRAWATLSSAQASVTAVGRPRATSAAKLGPERTAGQACGSASARTSVSRRFVDCSTPLAHSTTGFAGATWGASVSSTPRICWAGVTISTASAAAACVRSPVARIWGSSAMPGRKVRFSCAPFTASITAASRAQSVTSRPAVAATCASAVPHAPAPITAILSYFRLNRGSPTLVYAASAND